MLDASVLIARSGWPRWPHEVILAGLRGAFQLVRCPYVIRQVERVLERRFPGHLDRYAEFLSQTAWEIVPDPSPDEVARQLDLVRDASDVPIALAAIQAGVDYLVSEDKDLTAQDATTAALRQQVTVLLSGTFLRQVLGWSSEALEEIRQRTWGDMEA